MFSYLQIFLSISPQLYCYREQQLFPSGGLLHCSSLPQQVFPAFGPGYEGVVVIESNFFKSALPQVLHCSVPEAIG